MSLQEQVTDIVGADKDDCEKMATHVDAFITAHQREFVAVAEWSKHLTPGQNKAYYEK